MQDNHGGNIHRFCRETGLDRNEILDFSASINPLGYPDWIRAVVNRNLDTLVHYPEPEAGGLSDAIAKELGIPRETVLPGNGSSELIYLIAGMYSGKKAIIPVPAYNDYAAAARGAGLEIDFLYCAREEEFRLPVCELEKALQHGPALVFLGQPANPTGLLIPGEQICQLAETFPTSLFCLDEAFADFLSGYKSLATSIPDNMVVLRSLTKFYALPGLRLGYTIAVPQLIEKMRQRHPAWMVNSLAQAIGPLLFKDKSYREKTLSLINGERAWLQESLAKIKGLKSYPSVANFLLVEIQNTTKAGTASQLTDRLLKRGIAIRDCSNIEGLNHGFFRIAVRTREENGKLVEALADYFHSPTAQTVKRRQKKPCLMLQGTSSNAGKSILATAFCRIFLQDGYHVAPFKAQNLSLNSHVTRAGGEMGRAQVVQAQACRRQPDVRMNPVLLKPGSDTGSQIIIRGKVWENTEALDCYQRKNYLFNAVCHCYDSLSEENDIIVLEGAGSPAEVNLKEQDIVNMNMARYAGSPVLLCGDIERGGVFAAFIGTLDIFNEAERDLVKGFLINKFHGNTGLLTPAFSYLKEHTGKDVLGIIPWIPDLGLPEEDSVSFREQLSGKSNGQTAAVQIALIDLPHISNFTDMDALMLEPDVQVTIIRKTAELTGTPDIMILPGSKNVIHDLNHLERLGLSNRILELARAGKTEIIGICGGFQMLGTNIADPVGIESIGMQVKGLGLLPIETLLEPGKILKFTEAVHIPSGLGLRGYEIHHGVTHAKGLAACVQAEHGILGYGNREQMIWGTYLHGLFDDDTFRRWLIDRVRRRKGLPPLEQIQVTYDLEANLDQLADTVRQAVDMRRIYAIMGI